MTNHPNKISGLQPRLRELIDDIENIKGKIQHYRGQLEDNLVNLKDNVRPINPNYYTQQTTQQGQKE